VSVALVAAYLALRLPNLRAQPVFCDEATYLRWAQLVAQDPGHNAFVSMEDAKPPLHYWLLALARPLNADPVYAGRLLSVLLGALSVPALLVLCRELERLGGGHDIGPLAALFLIVCPLAAMNQRMALAEPLLLLEAVALGWLALRLARRITERVPAAETVGLGLLWGATLLTKQNFSYLLWTLPPAALVARLSRDTWRKQLRGFLPRYCVATLIGLACFVPTLLASDRFDLRTRLFYKPLFTVGSTDASRWQIVSRNVALLWVPRVGTHIQWWSHDVASPLQSGMLYLYLTPSVLLLTAIAGPWMLGRARPALLFLCVWAAALLGPLLAGARLLFSRFLLVGATPLLIAAAWMAAEMLATRGIVKRLAALTAVSSALAWPLWMTVAMTRDFSNAPLGMADREQYVDHAADLVEQAVAWLDSQADIHPISVVTRNGLGLENDLTWLLLGGVRNVQLLADDSLPPLHVGGDGTVRVSLEQWRRELSALELEPNRPIYYLAFGWRHPGADSPAFVPSQQALGPNTRLARAISEPERPTRSTRTIGIFQLGT